MICSSENLLLRVVRLLSGGYGLYPNVEEIEGLKSMRLGEESEAFNQLPQCTKSAVSLIGVCPLRIVTKRPRLRRRLMTRVIQDQLVPLTVTFLTGVAALGSLRVFPLVWYAGIFGAALVILAASMMPLLCAMCEGPPLPASS